MFLSLVLALFASTIHAESLPRGGIETQYSQIVYIERQYNHQTWHCTGAIARQSFIVTAAHCVGRLGTSVDVVFQDDSAEKFKVVFKGMEATGDDFAIIKGDTHTIEPLQLSSYWPDHDDMGFFITQNPEQQALPLITLYTETDGSLVFIGRLIGGDSGSPMLNSFGQIGAIMYARDVDGPHCYGVGAPRVKAILEHLK